MSVEHIRERANAIREKRGPEVHTLYDVDLSTLDRADLWDAMEVVITEIDTLQKAAADLMVMLAERRALVEERL